MKVIDLLNKIANGEEVPNEIIYNGLHYYNVGNKTQAYYENSELDEISFIGAIYSESHLNDEVEIDKPFNERVEEIYNKHIDYIYNKLEDKKIEKLELQDDGNTITLFGKNENEWTILNNVDVLICDKINEIIEVINERTI